MFRRRRSRDPDFAHGAASHEDAVRSLPDAALPAALRDSADTSYGFAVVREAARRTIGLRAFDVQIVGASALLRGAIAEMATGEGKTLVALLPACLWALEGRGVHVLTANDYLARRDAEWMGPVYAALDLSVGWIQQRCTASERAAAYACDVTYAPATEVGFDFLRDRLAVDPGQVVQRQLHTALIDEVDSILIDEARIPLVIAGGYSEPDALAPAAAAAVAQLVDGDDYFVDVDRRAAMLTESGFERVAQLLDRDVEDQDMHLAVHHALQARTQLRRDVDYIIRDGGLELVDEHKGRVAYRRRWPDGLQAAVEAREGLAQTPEARILSAITLQSLVKLYERIAGMTGTAQTSSGELREQYGLEVVVVPTNRPVQREDLPDVVYDTMAEKHAAVTQRIAAEHAIGRPVLVGTASVAESERISALLDAVGVAHRVLNARQDAEEAVVIASAGALAAVTLSTNMAGRGVDIRLGGPDERDRDAVTALGGLLVVGTNRHNAQRIDLQLRGRAGRQGDPGTSQFLVSLEDPIVIEHELTDLLTPESGDNRRIEKAQAGIDWAYTQMRTSLARYSEIVEEQRRAVHAWRAGVLHGDSEPAVREVTLLVIDDAWAHHLEHLRDLQETADMTWSSAGPLETFRTGAAKAFVELMGVLKRRVEDAASDPDEIRAQLPRPGATWSLMLTEAPLRSAGYTMRDLLRSRWKQGR